MNSKKKRSPGKDNKQLLEKLQNKLARSELCQAEQWLQYEHEKVDEKLRTASRELMYGNTNTKGFGSPSAVDTGTIFELATEKFGDPENAARQLQNVLKRHAKQSLKGEELVVSLQDFDDTLLKQIGATVSRVAITKFIHTVDEDVHHVHFKRLLNHVLLSNQAKEGAKMNRILQNLRSWVSENGLSRMEIISAFSKLDLEKTGSLTVPLATSGLIHELGCTMSVQDIKQFLGQDQYHSTDAGSVDYLAVAKDLTLPVENKENSTSHSQSENTQGVPEIEQQLKLLVIEGKLSMSRLESVLFRCATIGNSRTRNATGMTKFQLERALDQLQLPNLATSKVDELFERYKLDTRNYFDYQAFLLQLNKGATNSSRDRDAQERIQQVLASRPRLLEEVIRVLEEGSRSSSSGSKREVEPDVVERALASIPITTLTLQSRKRFLSEVFADDNRRCPLTRIVDMLTKSRQEMKNSEENEFTVALQSIRNFLIRIGIDKSDFWRKLGGDEYITTIRLLAKLKYLGWRAEDPERTKLLLEKYLENSDGTIPTHGFVDAVYESARRGNGPRSASKEDDPYNLRQVLRQELRIPFPVEENLKERFKEIDSSSGKVASDEFLRLLVRLGLNASRSAVLSELVDRFDTDGVVQWKDFVDFYMSKDQHMDQLRKADSQAEETDSALSISDLLETGTYSPRASRASPTANFRSKGSPSLERLIRESMSKASCDPETLTKFFEIYDEAKSGFVNVNDVHDIFESLNIPITNTELVDFLFQHQLVDETGSEGETKCKVDYHKLIRVLGIQSNFKTQPEASKYDKLEPFASSPRSRSSKSQARTYGPIISSPSPTRISSKTRKKVDSSNFFSDESSDLEANHKGKIDERIRKELSRCKLSKDDFFMMLEAHQLHPGHTSLDEEMRIHLDDLASVVRQLLGDDFSVSIGEFRFRFPRSIGERKNKINISAFIEELFSGIGRRRRSPRRRAPRTHKQRRYRASQVDFDDYESDTTSTSQSNSDQLLHQVHEQVLRILEKRNLKSGDLEKSVASHDPTHSGFISKAQLAKELRSFGVTSIMLGDIEQLANEVDMHLVESGQALNPKYAHSYHDGLIRYEELIKFLTSPIDAARENNDAIRTLSEENEQLRHSLKQFDLGFFEEVEDLKFKYEKTRQIKETLEQHVWTLCAATGVPPPPELPSESGSPLDLDLRTDPSGQQGSMGRIERALSSSTVRALQEGRDPVQVAKASKPAGVSFFGDEESSRNGSTGDLLRLAVLACKSPADLVEDLVDRLESADWGNQGTVMTSQFCEILMESFKAHQVEDTPHMAPASALSRAFDPVNSGQVQYREFLCVLRPMLSLHKPDEAETNTPVHEGIEDRIREGVLGVVDSREEVLDLFRAVDRRRLGRIATNQFVRVLETLGVELTLNQADEFGKANEFGDPAKTNWIHYSRFVRWLWSSSASRSAPSPNRRSRHHQARRCRSADPVGASESLSSTESFPLHRRSSTGATHRRTFQGRSARSRSRSRARRAKPARKPARYLSDESDECGYSPHSKRSSRRRHYVSDESDEIGYSPQSKRSSRGRRHYVSEDSDGTGYYPRRKRRSPRRRMDSPGSRESRCGRSARSSREGRRSPPPGSFVGGKSPRLEQLSESLSPRTWRSGQQHSPRGFKQGSRSSPRVGPGKLLGIQERFRSGVLRKAIERSAKGSIDVHQTFELLDTNKDGVVGGKELEIALLDMDIPTSRLERSELLRSITDSEYSDGFTFEEFCLFLTEGTDQMHEKRKVVLHDRLLSELQRLVYSGPTGFRMQEAFEKLDSHHDGAISRHQLGAILEAACPIPISDFELRELFEMIDKNQNGRISYSEFVEFVGGEPLSPLRGRAKELEELEVIEDKVKEVIRMMADNGDGVYRIREVFQKFDANGSQCITTAEFGSALESLGFHPRPGHMSALLRYFDSNNDGFVNYGDFLHFVISETHGKGVAELNKESNLRKQAETHLLNLEAILRKKLKRLRVGPSLRPQFRRFDRNKTGELSYAEFGNMLKSLGFNLDQVEEEYLATRIDSANRGSISYIEFAAFVERSDESSSRPVVSEVSKVGSQERSLSGGKLNLAAAAVRKLKRGVQMRQCNLRTMFSEFLDPRHSKNRELSKTDFRDCFRVPSSSTRLDHREVDALFDAHAKQEGFSPNSLGRSGDGVIDAVEFVASFMDLENLKTAWRRQAGKQLRSVGQLSSDAAAKRVLQETLVRCTGKRELVSRSEFTRYIKQLGFALPDWQTETLIDLCIMRGQTDEEELQSQSSEETSDLHYRGMQNSVPVNTFPEILYPDGDSIAGPRKYQFRHTSPGLLGNQKGQGKTSKIGNVDSDEFKRHYSFDSTSTDSGSSYSKFLMRRHSRSSHLKQAINSGVSSDMVLPILLALRSIESKMELNEDALDEQGFASFVQHYIDGVTDSTLSTVFDFLLHVQQRELAGTVDGQRMVREDFYSCSVLEDALTRDCGHAGDEVVAWALKLDAQFQRKLRQRTESFDDHLRNLVWGFRFMQQGFGSDSSRFSDEFVDTGHDRITFENIRIALSALGVGSGTDGEVEALLFLGALRGNHKSAALNMIFNKDCGLAFHEFVDWVAPLSPKAEQVMEKLRSAIQRTARVGGGAVDYRRAFNRLVDVAKGGKGEGRENRIPLASFRQAIQSLSPEASRDVVDELLLRAGTKQGINIDSFVRLFCPN